LGQEELIGGMAHSRTSSFTVNSGPVKGHSRNSSLTSLLTVRTSQEETLDHDIYLLSDQKGTFSNLDKLSRLKNCIHYIYGTNVIVKLLARPGKQKKTPNNRKTFQVIGALGAIFALEMNTSKSCALGMY
jgi:hypothetical protein